MDEEESKQETKKKKLFVSWGEGAVHINARSCYSVVLPRYRKRHSQWPRGLRRRSTAARLLGLWVRIPPGAWMFVCCECCVSG